jgi:bifunctional N-acetylglucosamine-1-phosphate-uridyltransferase/glucosamine-1-phosphate-acetyltransferase GlmU-like protein
MGGTYNLIIPAAGRGSRMKQSIPKALSKFKGKTIIEFQIDKFINKESNIIVVVSDSDRKLYDFLLEKYELKVQIVVQDKLDGTARAVATALKVSQEDLNVICWADQVGLSQVAIAESVNATLQDKKLSAVIPIQFCTKPYVRARIEDGKLLGWSYQREGEANPPGFSDLGFFVVRKRRIMSLIEKSLLDDSLRSRITNEINFLDVLPICQEEGKVKLIEFADKNLLLAINTQEELNVSEALYGK